MAKIIYTEKELLDYINMTLEEVSLNALS